MLFKKYNKCIYCNSSSLIKEKTQYSKHNFYTEAVQNDLEISKKKLKQLKVYRCRNCKNYQSNPWFSENHAKKIYSNIYGQHNRSWSNLINFFQKGKVPDHGKLFEILNNNIKIKNYAEFNSPFMGLMINLFEIEYKKNLSFYKKVFKNTLDYLSSRQLAGNNALKIKSSTQKAKKFLLNCKNLKRNFLIKKKINKYLFVDNSSLCWGQNDNYKSVNSRSLGSELLEMEIINFNIKKTQTKFDLFGIFHTLDHTFEPNRVLNFALNSSKYVIVYCHIDKQLKKQHLFSFSRDFLKFLNKKKIYTFDITNLIDKSFYTPEMYFLCSKNKILIERIKI